MRPISPESTEFASASPLQSPRSSISSSHRSGMPLTPVYELDNVATDMVVTRRSAGSGGSGLEDADKGSPRSERGLDKAMMNLIVDEKGGGNGNGSGRHSLPSLTVPIPSFGNYSFPPSSSPASSSAPGSSPGIEVGRGSSPVSTGNGMSDEDIALPQAGFTFGTCPSTTFLGTPTAEQGPFEYPDTSSSSSLSISPPLLPGSPTLGRRPSLALGMTHRRGSIVAHPHGFPVPPVVPSPPSTRRSSTCSTIVTLPVAGRRPSILHSATVESSVPQAQADLAGSPLEEIAPLPVSGPSSRRGSTLMFPHKPLLAPIPPSLLARRGSLPAAQLFGLPLTEQPNRLRASYSAGSHTTTTASLYHRRQSVASESGLSTGSGATVMDRDRGGNDQSQIRRESFTMRSATTPTSEVNPNTFPGTRRGSVSFFPPQYNSTTSTSSNSSSSISHQLHHQTPVRSSSISSRSSVASGSSGRSSFSSSRVPINFSPRHPNYPHTYHSNTTTTSVSRQNSLTRGGTSSSPSSPRLGSTSTSSSFSFSSSSSIAAGSRRTRHSSSAGVFLGHGSSGLSSSEESNEDEEEAEEELPTPSQSSLTVGTAAVAIRDAQSQGLDDGLPVPTGSGPTFVDPWSSKTMAVNSGDEEVVAGLDSSIVAKGTYVPLETPPLETVHERPPLETVDSGATERP